MVLLTWQKWVSLFLVCVFLFLAPGTAQANGCYYGGGYNYYQQPYYNYYQQPYYYPTKYVERVVLDYYPVFQVGYIPPASVTTTTTQTVQAASVTQSSGAALVGGVAVGGGGAALNAGAGGVAVPTCEQKLNELSARFTLLEQRLATFNNGTTGTLRPRDPVPERQKEPSPPPMEPVKEPSSEADKAPNPKNSAIVHHCGKCHDATVAAARGKDFTMTKDGHPLKLGDLEVGKTMRKLASGDMPKDHKLNDEAFSAVVNELLTLSK